MITKTNSPSGFQPVWPARLRAVFAASPGSCRVRAHRASPSRTIWRM